MNRITLTLAFLIAAVGVQAASGQYVVYYPSTAAYAPVTTYYSPAPATSYYSYYAPSAVPTTTYYESAPAPVTTYYAPSYSYYQPSYSYYAPAPVVAAPTTYVTRYRPLLGGTVTTAYYGYTPRTYVYWRY